MRKPNPFMRIVPAVLFVFLISSGTGCLENETRKTANINKLKAYNVSWDSPSKDHHGSMPVGNGDIGLNVWVEQNGELCFYIGKTDSWGDNGRLLKVGKIRVASEPAIVFPGAAFMQELDLETGTIFISSHGKYEGKQLDFKLSVWVDANHPVVHISYTCSIPVKMSAHIEMLRTEPNALPENPVCHPFLGIRHKFI